MPTLESLSPCRYLLILCLALCSPLAAEELADRRAGLLDALGQPFEDDHCTFETALDLRSFADLLGIRGPKILDNPSGWSVEARTAGRPFLCLDEISIDSTPWPFDPAGFSPGSSGIPPAELQAHFAAGKTVNRLWFIHPASNGFPIVLVLTPDGFLNIGAAQAPKLQGAAVRLGFIGEPFDLSEDFDQHVERLNLIPIDDDHLRLLFDLHSETGEAAIEILLSWDRLAEEPRLTIRTAQVSRFDDLLGVAGINFLRGPALSGLLSQFGTPEAGIEAFHDGRSIFLERPDGSVERRILVPPVDPGLVLREDITAYVPAGSRLIMDQPQGVSQYFSKFPGIPYQHRTDLIFDLIAASSPVVLRRAQKAVDLEDVNPEANETANIFLAMSMLSGQIQDIELGLSPAAEDFERRFPASEEGVVYVSEALGEGTSLFFLPLDADLMPSGSPRPLTDATIRGPRRPSVSADGHRVIFDAHTDRDTVNSRIYLLDLDRGNVRRLTVDPFGSSADRMASLSPWGDRLAFVSTRRFNPLLNIETVKDGLGSGFGNQVTCAEDAAWSTTRPEIAITCRNELLRWPLSGGPAIPLLSKAGVRAPAFSPDGRRLAYAADSGLYVAMRNGADDSLVQVDGEHPTWAGGSALIIERQVGGESDLFRLDLDSGGLLRLTPVDGVDATEPAFVRPSLPVFKDNFESGDLSFWAPPG